MRRLLLSGNARLEAKFRIRVNFSFLAIPAVLRIAFGRRLMQRRRWQTGE
jgi:hypothetical protein